MMIKKLINFFLSFFPKKKSQDRKEISKEDFYKQILEKSKKEKIKKSSDDSNKFLSGVETLKNKFVFSKQIIKIRELFFKNSIKHEKLSFKEIKINWKEIEKYEKQDFHLDLD